MKWEVKMTNKKLAIAFALLALPGLSAAATFNYNHVNAGFTSFSSDIKGIPEDLEGNGFGIGLSLNANEHFAILFQYAVSSADVTTSGSTFEGDSYSTLIGGYFHTPVNVTTDLLLGVGFLQGNVEMTQDGTSLGDEDVSGHIIQAGFKTMLAQNIELNAAVSQSEIEDDSSSSVILGGALHLSKEASIGASFESEDDGSAFSLSVAKYF